MPPAKKAAPAAKRPPARVKARPSRDADDQAPSAGAQEYLEGNIKRVIASTITPTPVALADLRYFSLQASAGRVMAFEALRKWMGSRHGLPLGRTAMYSLCERHGIRVWWAR